MSTEGTHLEEEIRDRTPLPLFLNKERVVSALRRSLGGNKETGVPIPLPHPGAGWGVRREDNFIFIV